VTERIATKVIGKPDDLNLELFQTIVTTGHMCLQRCDECATFSHPPRMYCRTCFSGNYTYPQISGAGAVYSYTISRHTAEAAWQDELPYLTVVVELDEGPRVVGAATLADPTAVRIGQRVHVVPEKRTDDFAYFTVVFDDDEAG
jgi:uncharacterized protein